MGRRDAIRAAIAECRAKINKYNWDIDELQRYRLRMVNLCDSLADTTTKTKLYDLTREDRWRGRLQVDADEQRDYITSGMNKAKIKTEDFIANIDRAISRLRQMIQDCEDEITKLEFQLACCED